MPEVQGRKPLHTPATITQYIQKRLGKTVGLFYSLANLLIFSTITLGAALFWGAYAADLVFSDYLSL